MDDPILNCLLAVCCPPEARVELLTKLLMTECGVAPDAANNAAAWLLSKFEFAPAGSLTQLKDTIAACARGEDYKA